MRNQTIARFEMRSVLLCIILVTGFSTPIYGQQLKSITNSIGMKLVLIHVGSFTMGSPVSEEGRNEDETPHEVTITKSYYLGIYEVTQEQYEKVMGENPAMLQPLKGDTILYPVTSVKWDDSVSFCRKLTELPNEKAVGRHYRLPTEAEWEYAYRAHSTTAYCFGDSTESLEEYAWFGEGQAGSTHPVGEKKANRWGLYDMHGNICEWCQDWYAAYPSNEAIDPYGPSEGSSRVVRGGNWAFGAGHCRSAHRYGGDPSIRINRSGFRVAMSLPVKQRETASSK